MEWQVEFTDIGIKTLKKLDKHTAAMIVGYIEKNLVGDINPRTFGKLLVGNHKCKWRYRIGDFRLFCKIEDNKVTGVVVQVENRKDVYKKK